VDGLIDDVPLFTNEHDIVSRTGSRGLVCYCKLRRPQFSWLSSSEFSESRVLILSNTPNPKPPKIQFYFPNKGNDFHIIL